MGFSHLDLNMGDNHVDLNTSDSRKANRSAESQHRSLLVKGHIYIYLVTKHTNKNNTIGPLFY